ncbi:MAG: biotin--[acetyl-CoA-carboxylase] ligase [Clostridiales bacterium]|nr:biotin--[acetyl-CoA-carboxylase] ligase [Clostridiales bacterium]
MIDIRSNLHIYDTVTSTNDEVFGLMKRGAPDGTAAVAGMQTSGKGSHGRRWQSGPEGNIYCSVGIKNGITSRQIAVMPMVTALAVRRAMELYMETPIWIKWPNDVIAGDRKICGILAEYHEVNGENILVIGFGINVNQRVFHEDLKDKASSMYILEKKQFDTRLLLSSVLEELESVYPVCMESDGLGRYREEIEQCLIRMGDVVRLTRGDFSEKAVIEHLNNDGSLCVLKDDGRIHDVYAGEISLRGEGGYI